MKFEVKATSARVETSMILSESDKTVQMFSFHKSVLVNPQRQTFSLCRQVFIDYFLHVVGTGACSFASRARQRETRNLTLPAHFCFHRISSNASGCFFFFLSCLSQRSVLLPGLVCGRKSPYCSEVNYVSWPFCGVIASPQIG